MYQLRSQGVKAAAKEIDFIDQSVLYKREFGGIVFLCTLVKYVSINKPRGYSCSRGVQWVD